MKIAMFGHKRIPSREGGVEIVVESLAKRMAKLGHEVTVYNRSGSNVAGNRFGGKIRQKVYEGVRLVSIPTPKSKALNAVVYSFFASVGVSLSNADIVHIHAEGPAAFCAIPKAFKKRVIVTIHGLDWQRSKWGGFASKFLKYGEKCAVKHADEIIVLSKSAQNYFKNTYNRNTVVIPNGIDRVKYEEADIITKKYGLRQKKYILYLGRIVPEKGIHYLIDAYKSINTGLPLVIAGGSSHSGEYFNSLKASAEGENIIFTDFVEGKELRELYSNALLYVLPSDLEGMPISLLEAMSCGTCCLASDIPECTEVCEKHAVYFKHGDTADLKKKLQLLLADTAKIDSYASESADFITSKYNWDDVTNKTLAVYRGESV